MQVHKFVVGVAPVRSLCRVGWAAKQLLSIPADQLRNTTSSSSSNSHSINNDVGFTRQLRRGVTTLARAVTLEALGLGASVAGGADFVLRGGSGSGSDHPAGKAQPHNNKKHLYKRQKSPRKVCKPVSLQDCGSAQKHNCGLLFLVRCCSVSI